MKVSLFLDTGVLLDFFLSDSEKMRPMAVLLDLVARKKVRATVSSVTLANLSFLLERAAGRKSLEADIIQLLEIIHVAPLNGAHFAQAVALNVDDFENALNMVCAKNEKCQFLITRHIRSYRNSSITVLEPSQFLNDFKMSAF